MRKWLAVAGLLLFLGCGHDGFNSVPSYVSGPVMPAGGYSVPTGSYPPISAQLPYGYPQSFIPFAPFYNYVTTNGSPQYWNNLWTAWQQYAPSMGYNIYDFQPFWYQFVPQIVNQNFYSWFDESVYSPGGYSYCGCND